MGRRTAANARVRYYWSQGLWLSCARDHYPQQSAAAEFLVLASVVKHASLTSVTCKILAV